MDEFLDVEAKPFDGGDSNDDGVGGDDDTGAGMFLRLLEVMMPLSLVHLLSVAGRQEANRCGKIRS